MSPTLALYIGGTTIAMLLVLILGLLFIALFSKKRN